jgi:SAM-dependent methyltransferase
MSPSALLRSLPGVAGIKRIIVRRQAALRFRKEFLAFEKLLAVVAGPQRFRLRWEERYPCLEDRTSFSGFDRHYIYHTAWAARILARIKPVVHTDISSTLYFCSIVSAFVPTRFYDYRPADLRLEGLDSGHEDLSRLSFVDGSIHSLSCMHVVEHIGLARYGEPMDMEGDLKAMRELSRVLAPGGSLLFVVPVGEARICFNAHRIYNYSQILSAFSELDLVEFALIPDDPASGGLLINPPQELTDSQQYGCGCFWFQRRR